MAHKKVKRKTRTKKRVKRKATKRKVRKKSVKKTRTKKQKTKRKTAKRKKQRKVRRTRTTKRKVKKIVKKRASKKKTVRRTKKKTSKKYANCIVKRRGHEQEYDDKKVYGTCYAACRDAQLDHAHSERLCAKVTKHMNFWAKKKRKVNSDQIFQKMIILLKKQNHAAAFMYETHRDLC